MGRGKPCKQRRKKSFWGEKPSPRESSRNPFSCVGARGTGQTLHPLSMGCGQSCQPSTARYRDLPAPCSLGTITHVKFPDKNLLCLIFPFPETNEYPVKNLGCHSPSCAFVLRALWGRAAARWHVHPAAASASHSHESPGRASHPTQAQ